jgi:DNA polymerase III delta prime subunit
LDQVKYWIHEALQPNPQSHILLLCGPPGAGKTTMIDVLLKAYNVIKYEHDVQNDEWSEEKGQNNSYKSRLKHFQEFLSQSSRYRTLRLYNILASEKTFIVINELPFVRPNSAQHKERHEILKNFLITNSNHARNPTIIIHHIYESSTTYANIWQNFPKEFIDSPRVTRIDINPMTEKTISQVLEHIYSIEKTLNKIHSINKDMIESLALNAGGDLRQAIQQLQFHSIPGIKKKKETKCPRKKIKLTHEDVVNNRSEVLDAKDDISRDSYVNLFHATGRVLHAKRNKDGTLEKDLEKQVLHKIHAQENNQVNYLYENYVKFSKVDADFDALQKCIDSLSIADTFAHIGEDSEDRQFYLYSFLIANKGYQYYNQNNIIKGKFLSVTAPKIRTLQFENSNKMSQLTQILDKTAFINHAHERNAFMGELVPYIGKIQRRNPINNVLKGYYFRGTPKPYKGVIVQDDSAISDNVVDEEKENETEEIICMNNYSSENENETASMQQAVKTNLVIDQYSDSE